MHAETALNELAAAVVAAGPTDLQELARVHEGLLGIQREAGLPAEAGALVSKALECVEQIILEQCRDANEAIAQLGELIAKLQGLCEGRQLPEQAAPEPSAGAGAPESPTPDASSEPAAGATESSELSADPALLAEFVTESLEHLDRAEAALLDLESNPGNAEGINSIFRAFHTIKGTSGFLGLSRINAVAHKAETLLDRARKGEIQLAGGYADLALEATDVLKRLVLQARDSAQGNPQAETEGVDALLERLDCQDEPPPREPAPLRVGDILVARDQADRAEVERAAGQGGAGRVGEKLVRCGVASAAQAVEALRTQRQLTGEPAAGRADSTLRVSMARLDKLIDMVGELVIAQSMLRQDPVICESDSQALARKVSQMDKISRELQDLTLSMRMVPLKSTFQKMARLVRDLGRKSGKDVRFVAEGEDTEIDRNMVDAISDPLVHMMRNAVDHGIEPPADREAAGKPAQGTVSLRAYHAAGKVVIEIQDDGRGIDPERIRAKAVERGLIDAEAQLSRAEIFDLLFLPGFSTAEKVTDVSGRGVGMDVVRKNIEALRGRVEIASEKGKGSVFTIRLPLTLAIIDGMLLKVGREQYVIPTLNIEQAFRPEREALSTVRGQGEMVLLRGALIPVFRLHRLFGVAGAVEDPVEGLLVVVENEGQRCALLADALLGQQQVVIKSLGRALGDVLGVSGAAILGDGRVGLILDVGGVIRLAQGRTAERAA